MFVSVNVLGIIEGEIIELGLELVGVDRDVGVSEGLSVCM